MQPTSPCPWSSAVTARSSCAAPRVRTLRTNSRRLGAAAQSPQAGDRLERLRGCWTAHRPLVLPAPACAGGALPTLDFGGMPELLYMDGGSRIVVQGLNITGEPRCPANRCYSWRPDRRKLPCMVQLWLPRKLGSDVVRGMTCMCACLLVWAPSSILLLQAPTAAAAGLVMQACRIMRCWQRAWTRLVQRRLCGRPHGQRPSISSPPSTARPALR